MKNHKRAAGGVGVILGFFALILIIDILSKPSNVAISVKPIESLQTYFFGFVFVMGDFGWILGSFLLLVFLASCYAIGTWINILFSK